MVFDIKNAKVNEDGSITDGNTTKKEGDAGFHLIKSRILKGNVSTARNNYTVEQLKEMRDKKTPMTFNWLKLTMKINGYSLNRSGFEAIKEAIMNMNFNMVDLMETMKNEKSKTVTKNMVDISLGKETEATKKRLEIKRRKEERAKEIAERKERKAQEKAERLQKRIDEQRARKQAQIAKTEAKLQTQIEALNKKQKELQKQNQI